MNIYSDYQDNQLQEKSGPLQRSGQSSELVYSAGDGSNRWGVNTEDHMSTMVKSPATTNVNISPMRGIAGSAQSSHMRANGAPNGQMDGNSARNGHHLQ